MGSLLKFSLFLSGLLTVYFILLRFNDNLDELLFSDLLHPLALIVPVVIIITIIFGLITKKYAKISIISSVSVILFFTYMPLHDLLFDYQIGKHVILLPLVAICFSIFLYFLIKSNREFEKLLKISFVIVALLVMSNVIEIGFYSNVSPYTIDESQIPLFSPSSSPLPNVYHILLDEHSGTNALQEFQNYDNSNFDDTLIEKGFFIPEYSFSNYHHTRLALPSILNMDYIDVDLELDQKEYVVLLEKMVINNQVTEIFKKNGYELIYFYNEVNLKPSIDYGVELCNNSIGGTQFLSFILDQTPLFIAKNVLDKGNFAEIAQNRLCVFDELPKLHDAHSVPIFVHAHIMLPHDPFVFYSDGSIVEYGVHTPANHESMYLSQLEYTDLLILTLVEKLLVQDPPPVIIIQSDHGFRAGTDTDDAIRQSYSNFAAFYFPDSNLSLEKDSFQTPVNSFRLMFNENFDTDYPLLENRMYLEIDDEFVDVTDILVSNSD